MYCFIMLGYSVSASIMNGTDHVLCFTFGRLVCDDISGGQENLPIPATNLVDDPPVPPSGMFSYHFSISNFLCWAPLCIIPLTGAIVQNNY